LQLRANAKINSYLDVLARREDGYHEIRTVFHEIDLCDTLRFTLTDNNDIQIFANVKTLQNQDNLICRISRYIQESYNVQAGVSVELEKAIPVAAGLGGGSSNAAATICALNDLWELDLSKEEMHDIAARFGSDINFFLLGGCAAGYGRGERLEPLPDRLIEHIVLVNPGFGVSSGEAYGAVEHRGATANWAAHLGSADAHLAYNALQAGVCSRYPVIAGLMEDLRVGGAQPLLSGSGPTVIGFCQDDTTAATLAEEFRRRGLWSVVTRAVPRRGRGCNAAPNRTYGA